MGKDYEENRKLLVAALVIILGGNAGSIVSAVYPTDIRDSTFSKLEGAVLEANLNNRISSVETRLMVHEAKTKECNRGATHE